MVATQQDGKPGFSKEGGMCLSSPVSSGKARMLGDGKKQTKILSLQCLYPRRSYELHLVLPWGWEDLEPGRESQHRFPLQSSLQQAGQEGGTTGLRGQRHSDGDAGGAKRASSWLGAGNGIDLKVHVCVCAQLYFMYSCGISPWL